MTTKIEVEEDYSSHDLGQYCLLFKEACRNLSLLALTPTESSILWLSLGNMRDDGQVLLNKPMIGEYLGIAYNSVKHAIEGLENRMILLPVSYGGDFQSHIYQVNFTHLVNPHLAFQGKLTSAKARNISEGVPSIQYLKKNGSSWIDIKTGEQLLIEPPARKPKKNEN